MDNVKRGYMPKDSIEFGNSWSDRMTASGQEILYLLNRNYDIKMAATFVGNHYLLSERQRMALARVLCSEEKLRSRKAKEVNQSTFQERVYVDGFNTIITLEVALSGSLLLEGMDGTIRDLAGLHGTYRIVDKTKSAVELLLKSMKLSMIKEAVIYLDEPVSNSGRLKTLFYMLAESYKMKIYVEVLPDVDRKLYNLENVITSDAIILDNCKSWYNLNRYIIDRYIPKAWIYRLDLKKDCI